MKKVMRCMLSLIRSSSLIAWATVFPQLDNSGAFHLMERFTRRLCRRWLVCIIASELEMPRQGIFSLRVQL